MPKNYYGAGHFSRRVLKDDEFHVAFDNLATLQVYLDRNGRASFLDFSLGSAD